MSDDELAWQAIERRLEARRRRVNDEISGYPQPIPACDAQFNHLLAERSRIAAELARMHEARRARRPAGDFAPSSDHVEAGAAQDQPGAAGQPARQSPS